MKRSRLSRKGSKARPVRMSVAHLDNDIQATKKAYADSFIPGTAKFGTPAWKTYWEVANQQRNLNWEGTDFHTPEDWLKIARLIGSYNEFEAQRVYDKLRGLPVKVKLAREGSVAVYVSGDKKSLDEVARRFRGYADEIDMVSVPNMVMIKSKTDPKESYPVAMVADKSKGERNRYLRLWFD